MYEVVWSRLLGLVFGNTIYAISTVLAAFMGGLALGMVLSLIMASCIVTKAPISQGKRLSIIPRRN